MAKIVVAPELCKECKLCIGVCPKKIIQIGSDMNSKGYYYAHQMDEAACTGCKLCAIMCPDAAISVYK